MYAKRKRNTKMVIAFEGTYFVEDKNLYSILGNSKADDISVKSLTKNYAVCFQRL